MRSENAKIKKLKWLKKLKKPERIRVKERKKETWKKIKYKLPTKRNFIIRPFWSLKLSLFESIVAKRKSFFGAQNEIKMKKLKRHRSHYLLPTSRRPSGTSLRSCKDNTVTVIRGYLMSPRADN